MSWKRRCLRGIPLLLGTAVLMLLTWPARGEEAARKPLMNGAADSCFALKVRGITAEECERFHLKPGEGVMIVWLDPAGPMRRVGFEAGDMILEVDGQVLEGLKNFDDLFNCFDHHKLMTLLGVDHRSGRSGYVQIVVP